VGTEQELIIWPRWGEDASGEFGLDDMLYLA
jgi:hypothetical protein